MRTLLHRASLGCKILKRLRHCACTDHTQTAVKYLVQIPVLVAPSNKLLSTLPLAARMASANWPQTVWPENQQLAMQEYVNAYHSMCAIWKTIDPQTTW